MQIGKAIAASLAVHLGVAGLPAGQLLPTGKHKEIVWPAAGGAAPLTLRLGLATLDTPMRQDSLSNPAALRAQAASAPQLESGSRGDGSRAGTGSAEALASALGLGLPVPRYYGPREVTRRAQPIEDIAPSPPGLGAVTTTGTLVLALWIGDAGDVERLEIESSAFDKGIGEVIAQQFRSIRFRPAEMDGVPVKSRMRIEVTVQPPAP